MSEEAGFFLGSFCLAFWGLVFILTRLIPNKKTVDKYGFPYDMAGDLFEKIAPILLGLGLLGMVGAGLVLLFD